MAKASLGKCPECGGFRVWKAGWDGDVQRFLCRACELRFSSRTGFHKPLNRPPAIGFGCQIGVPCRDGAINLAAVEPVEGGPSGAMEFARKLKAEGYAFGMIKGCVWFLLLMERHGVDLLKPDQVKEFIAAQKWQNKTKATAVVYYGIFAKFMHIRWDPPRYPYERKQPFIPLEREVDALIDGCGPKMSVLLFVLKETGARIGEVLRAEWRDVDLERRSFAINHPEKGSYSRTLPISRALAAALNSLPRKSGRIFPISMNTAQSNFRHQRNRLATKRGNSRLRQISFHTFRHFFATMLYAKTYDRQAALIVQQALGHKNIQNTMIYMHLVNFPADEYEVQVAETVDEAKLGLNPSTPSAQSISIDGESSDW